MPLRLIGALLVFSACTVLGWKAAASHRYEEQTLRQLLTMLDYMQSELHYHMTPLPELCRQASAEVKGALSTVFLNLAQEMDNQITPDVYSCMTAAVAKTERIPQITEHELEQLGQTLGRFDLDGQIKGLEAIKQECLGKLEGLCDGKDLRRRGYKTLALCAGAALVILFI